MRESTRTSTPGRFTRSSDAFGAPSAADEVVSTATPESATNPTIHLADTTASIAPRAATSATDTPASAAEGSARPRRDPGKGGLPAKTYLGPLSSFQSVRCVLIPEAEQPEGNMRLRSRDAAFTEYVEARQAVLLRYAYLLCGNWHRAEDATATALAKLYIHWPRIRQEGAEDAYARTVLRRVLVDDSRKPWRHEDPTDQLPDKVHQPNSHGYEDRAALLDGLLALPLKQRQCVALRYWLDLSIEATARELGISPGAVKSHTHRGLERLRSSLVTIGGPDED